MRSPRFAHMSWCWLICNSFHDCRMRFRIGHFYPSCSCITQGSCSQSEDKNGDAETIYGPVRHQSSVSTRCFETLAHISPFNKTLNSFSLSHISLLFRLTLKTNWDGSADGGFSLDFCQPGGHRFVHRFQIEITHNNVFSNSSHFHDISARGFTATEIVAIQRFARTLRDYPFLITSGSWVDFALVLVRLRTRTSGRLGAPVWVPRTVPLWRTATHGPTGYHHNVQNISNIHLIGSSCVHDFKNPRIFTFFLKIQMFVF